MIFNKVNHIKLEDLAKEYGRLHNMEFFTQGGHNAPRDRMTFDVELPPISYDSSVTTGEAKWFWYGYFNTPPEGFTPQIRCSSGNSHHVTISFRDMIYVLVQKGELSTEEDRTFVTYEW